MKNTISTLAILLSTITFAQQEVPLSGNFGGTRCNGSVGLCNIGQNPTGKSQGKLFAQKQNDNSFQLIILRSKLSDQEELSIIGKPISSLNQKKPPLFIVEEDFLLDNTVVRSIGLTDDYILIPAGEYPMSFDDEKVYIYFTLEKP